MPGTYSTSEVLKDVKGYPVACYFNPVTGLYEIMIGSNGAPNFQTIDGGIVTLGSKADAAVTDPTLSATEIAILKGLLKQLQGNGVGALPISVSGSSTNFSEETNASTNDTPYTANVKQSVWLWNDDATNKIQFNFDAAIGQPGTITLNPGDAVGPFNRAFTTLHVKAVAGTPAFRAWGV